MGNGSPIESISYKVRSLLNNGKRHSPSVVHLTGVDGLQGAALLKISEEGAALPGMYLSGPEGEPKLESPDAVSTAVTSGATKPNLVSYNFYNSAWPLASMTIASLPE
jgi:hypothetical protein